MAEPSRLSASEQVAAAFGWCMVFFFIIGGTIITGTAGWSLGHDPIIGLVAPVPEQHQVEAKCVTTVGLSPQLNATVTEAWPCSQSFYKPNETAPLCHARWNLLEFKITSWDRDKGEPACEGLENKMGELIAGIVLLSVGVLPLAIVSCAACVKNMNVGRRIADSNLRSTSTRTAVSV